MKFTGERYIPNTIDDDDEIKAEHVQRYQSVLDIVKGKVVLDAACGEGYGAELLVEQAELVFGLDIDDESIELAKKKYINPNLQFMTGSIANLPFEDNFFDVVVSFETIEHVSEEIQALFLKEIKRVLKHDGICIMSTPNKKVYTDNRNYKNPFHVKEFYKNDFFEFLNTSFENVEFYYQFMENVQLLSNEQDKNIKSINLRNNFAEHSKYILAICSDIAIIDVNINSMLIEAGTYNRNIERIIELQDEVEVRNKHIAHLDKEILEKDRYIKIIDESSRLSDVEKELEDLKKALLQSEKLKDNLIKDITEIRDENEILKQKERVLENIYISDGWNFLLKYYKLRDKIIPSQGKARLFIKLFKKIIVDGNYNLINKENAKKFVYYFKNQNLSMLENRVETYIDRNTNDNSQLNLTLIKNDNNYQKITIEKSLKPFVSIVIPVYNQWDYTYSCIKSIVANTTNVSYEIIVADDMSTDETINIDKYVENAVVVRDGQNRGFLLNCKNAAKSARGKYVLFLNNDTQVQEGWLDSLVELIESDASIGMVGSKLVYPDGRLQEAGGIIWDDASGWNFGRLDDPSKSEFNYVKEVDYISGAAIMINKQLWDEIGGFDERYVPAYYEDTDLAFEVRKHGFKVMYQPKSVVVHFEGISHGTDEGSNIKSYQSKNKNVFLAKWKNELETYQLPNAKDVFWARDRSMDKKTIVVIDHYVPHYDKDAGGRCTYYYLKLFKSLGYNVIFIGDNFYKHEPYTSNLQALGIQVLYGNEYAKNIEKWFKINGEYIDYVYLNRPHIAIKYVDMIRKYTNSKLIYFGHDLHYLRELRNYEVEGKPELLKSSNEWKKIEFDLFEKADVIHVVGSYEQSVLQKEFPNKPIRNIPLYMFNEEEINIEKETYQNRESILFVGGFGHKPNYDGVIWFINEVFPSILEQKPDMKFFIVGSNPPEDIKSLNSSNIIVTGYVTDEELKQYYSKSRIVVVPLRYGAGVKGKVVEAIYHQVPIVTTEVGSEGLNEANEYMMIAKDNKAFSKMVIDLYDDEKIWTSLSYKSKDYIKKYFTIDAASEQVKLDIN